MRREMSTVSQLFHFVVPLCQFVLPLCPYWGMRTGHTGKGVGFPSPWTGVP
jgi:hypothetical protein